MTDLNKLNELIKDKRVENKENEHGAKIFQITIELSDGAEIVGVQNEIFEEAEKDALKRAYEYAEKNGFFANVVEPSPEKKTVDCAVGMESCSTADGYNDFQQLDMKLMKGRFLVDVLTHAGNDHNLTTAVSTKLQSIIEEL